MIKIRLNIRYTLVAAVMILSSTSTEAQSWLEKAGKKAIQRVEDRSKKKVEDKINNAADKTVDGAFRKAEDVVNGVDNNKKAPAQPLQQNSDVIMAQPELQAEAPQVTGPLLTPNEIIAQVPSLPAPQAWASKNYQVFKNKMAELDAQAARVMQAGMMQTIPTQQDMEAFYANQQKQMAITNKQLEENFGFSTTEMMSMSEEELQAKVMAGARKAQAQGMEQMEKEMAVWKSLGITEADLKKVENMTDKQSEAYIKKRIAENGFSEADLRKRMEAAGVKMMSEEEWKEEEVRQQKAQKDAEAMEKAQETLAAYTDQMFATNNLIQEALQSAGQRIQEVSDKYKPRADELIAKISSTRDDNAYRDTYVDVNPLIDQYNQIIMQWRTEAYKVWSEYIITGQGYYKTLLTYAVASDEAKAKMPDLTGNAAIDKQQRVSNNAITVVMNYLTLTDSYPMVEYGFTSRDTEPGKGYGGKG